MSSTKTFETKAGVKVLVAVAVVAALAAVTSVAKQASHEATLAKQDAFEKSLAIQLAARERQGNKVASANVQVAHAVK